MGPAFLIENNMKQRFPRKLKKIAKKRKSKADAMIMVQSAMASAMGASRVASIQAQPSFGITAPKVLSAASVVLDTVTSISKVMAQIKPWQYYTRSN